MSTPAWAPQQGTPLPNDAPEAPSDPGLAAVPQPASTETVQQAPERGSVAQGTAPQDAAPTTTVQQPGGRRIDDSQVPVGTGSHEDGMPQPAGQYRPSAPALPQQEQAHQQLESTTQAAPESAPGPNQSLSSVTDAAAARASANAAAALESAASDGGSSTGRQRRSVRPEPVSAGEPYIPTVPAPTAQDLGASVPRETSHSDPAPALASEGSGSWDDRSVAPGHSVENGSDTAVIEGSAGMSARETHHAESAAVAPARDTITPMPARHDLDPEESRRAALVDSLPVVSDDTPLMAELKQDARRRIELRGRRFPRPPQTRIITVANQKGGVGKTTTTVNLAAALAQAGLNVLVLDNDPQGNASTALGVEHRAGTPSIYEVLVDGAPMADAVQESPDVSNLWCLPATIDLSGAEIELVSMVARETRLRNALDAYLDGRVANGQERIDYVFVDCPPSLGLLTVNAFVVAREVLIPIQCEYYALEGLSQLLKTIQLIQAHLNPRLHVSTILLTMYDARTNLAQQVATEVRTHFPERTLRTTVPRSVRISEAPSYGQTVMTYDAGSSGALAYLEAAREVAERGATELEDDHHSNGQASNGTAPTDHEHQTAAAVRQEEL